MKSTPSNGEALLDAERAANGASVELHCEACGSTFAAERREEARCPQCLRKSSVRPIARGRAASAAPRKRTLWLALAATLCAVGLGFGLWLAWTGNSKSSEAEAPDAQARQWMAYTQQRACTDENPQLRLKGFAIDYPRGFEPRPCWNNNYVSFREGMEGDEDELRSQINVSYLSGIGTERTLEDAADRAANVVAKLISEEATVRDMGKGKLRARNEAFSQFDYVTSYPPRAGVGPADRHAKRFVFLPAIGPGTDNGMLITATRRIEDDRFKAFRWLDRTLPTVVGSLRMGSATSVAGTGPKTESQKAGLPLRRVATTGGATVHHTSSDCPSSVSTFLVLNLKRTADECGIRHDIDVDRVELDRGELGRMTMRGHDDDVRCIEEQLGPLDVSTEPTCTSSFVIEP